MQSSPQLYYTMVEKSPYQLPGQGHDLPPYVFPTSARTTRWERILKPATAVHERMTILEPVHKIG